MEHFFSVDNWPVLLVCGMLLVSAVIDYWKLKVPNWLTFPFIISGWVYALGMNFGWWTVPSADLYGTGGGIGASLLLTFFAMMLLFPLWLIGGMGGGDVKMAMGFGSWIGALYPMGRGLGIVFFAFALAVIIGGLIALGMMFWRGSWRQNYRNMLDIVSDFYTSSGVSEIADRAAKRKPQLQLLPYGVPLCIGFVSYLFILQVIG